MNSAFTIASQEIRYWSRTKLALAVGLLALALICISVYSTANQISHEKGSRVSLQVKAEETFRSQPARHPHRMVHYGHYAFRAPTSLAALDPGVDPFTGTIIFLEGHRQNSATFSPNYDGAQAGPFSRLSPALAYQLLVPLVLIVMGFGVVSREREAQTDRQLIASGVTGTTLWFGKSLALIMVGFVFLLPLVIGVSLTGTDPKLALSFSSLYLIYLITWALTISAVSTWTARQSVSLLVLLFLWLIFSILLPRVLATTANSVHPNPSQIETDMDVKVALRAVSDGHNANDPAFSQLKATLLEEYSVDKVEDLPINFRGVVAQTAEADLTEILNEFAEKRMVTQRQQVDLIKTLEFISPFVALQSASMITAGTDLETHHRFLREAETTRFEFVQGLNKAHEQKMTYTDDINRSKNTESERRTRIGSDNWRVLNDFRFSADSSDIRINRVFVSMLSLIGWLIGFLIIGWVGSRRLPESKYD